MDEGVTVIPVIPGRRNSAAPRRDVRAAAELKRETMVKKPSWLRWSRREAPVESKTENLKKVRRRTDQKIRQQDAQKVSQDEKKQISSRGTKR